MIRRLSLSRIVRLGIFLGAMTQSIDAQAPRTADPSSDQFPWVAADTGRMIPGWRQFERYTWVIPGAMCENASEEVTRLLDRGRSRDTVAYAIEVARPFPVSARAVAEDCLVKSGTTLPNVTPDLPPPLLLTRLRLALVRQQDDEFHSILSTYLSQPHPIDEQLRVMASAFESARRERPLRIGLLEYIAEKTSGLGNDQRITLLRYGQWLKMTWHWIALGDTLRARAAIDTTIAIVRTPGMPVGWTFYERTSEISLEALLNYQLHLHVLQGGSRNAKIKPWLDMRINLDRTSDSVATTRFLSMLYGSMLRRYGEPFHGPDSAVHWYNTPNARNEPVRLNPATGIPSAPLTLVWQIDQNCSGTCYEQYQMLRHLYDKYAARGLEIIIVAKTQGYAPMAAGAIPPAQEADAIRDYVQETLNLPVKVVVQEAPFDHLPDGRRVNRTTTWDRRYQFENNPFGEASLDKFLVDRDNKIRMVEIGVLNEPILDLYITKYLPAAKR